MVSQDNRERPYKNIQELLKDYGYQPGEKEKARQEIEFVGELLSLKEEIEENFLPNADAGTVYSVQGAWGMGKTSFIKILIDEISNSAKINQQKLCYYFYDSLFYGDVSGAITTFLEQLFKRIEKQYAINLHGVQRKIAQNLSPSIEINGIFAKLKISQTRTNDTGSLITDNVKSKLSNIGGKIIIVVDDIDRLTSEEALHLLRMIRVVKEIPNTQILLPIDYAALITMIAKEKVADPGGYVRKIITKPIRLNSNLKDLGIFFQRNCVSELEITDSSQAQPYLHDLWLGYFWELSLEALVQLETRERAPIRLEMVMDGGRSNPEWQRAEALNGNRNIFVYDFFEKTRREYGAGTDYLMKFKVTGNPNLFHYYRYSRIAPNTTFDRFVRGRYDPYSVVGGGLELVGGKDMFTLEFYQESDVIELSGLAQNAEAERYEVNLEVAEKLDARKINFWDRFSELPLENLPPIVQRYVSPRMIRRLIDQLKSKKKQILETIQSPRSATNNLYVSTKGTIEVFVKESTFD